MDGQLFSDGLLASLHLLDGPDETLELIFLVFFLFLLEGQELFLGHLARLVGLFELGLFMRTLSRFSASWAARVLGILLERD
jgi:hypothetical protein